MGDSDDALKLYLRLPEKIVDEQQIKDLHPAISRVCLPRQPSRRWCFILFKDAESLLKARKAISKKKINNKKIIIGKYKEQSKVPEGVTIDQIVDIINVKKKSDLTKKNKKKDK